MMQKPLAYVEALGKGKAAVVVLHNGKYKRTVVSEAQVLMMKDLIEANPEWGAYEAFQYTNTQEFKDKLLGDLLAGLKGNLLQDQPGYSN